MKVEFNISRLEYLLKLYRLPINEFLDIISVGLINPITKKDLYVDEIKISLLKRIDKVFNKGIEYYINPKKLKENKDASIFFRKDSFNSELNIGAKKIVSQFEDLKISLSAISKLSDIDFERKFPIFSVNDEPSEVAKQVSKLLYPDIFTNVLRDFLKALISKLSEFDILVFEFVETWNKKDKANINGFFLSPNSIILKRQQSSFRREIFTLIHELGHYLLNEEEIEEVDIKDMSRRDISKIENWCNDFAYYFLIGENDKILKRLEKADAGNDYHFDLIDKISKETHLSKLALFTRLLYSNKISKSSYNLVRKNLEEEYLRKIEKDKKAKELEKLQGIKRTGSTPKPINSPLFVNTLQTALNDGVINEYDFCKKLNIKPENIDQYIR